MTASIRTIAVHLPAAAVADRLLDLAVPLAARHGATLIGIHGVPSVVLYADVTVPISTDFILAQQESFQAEAAAVERAFRGRAAAAPGLEWRLAEQADGPLMRALVESGFGADLIVASQADEAIPAAAGYSPADFVVGSGRPVLVVPAAGRAAVPGRRVLIAWNGRREAARAAFDSLPLIEPEAEVTLFTVGGAGQPQAAALARALARHRLQVKVAAAQAGDRPVADELLSRAAEAGADLLVMGCYGHSRLRETVFGGVTRNMLRRMTLPVLMSH